MGLPALLFLAHVWAKPPARLSTVVSIEDLQAEAKSQLKLLRGYTASAKDYADSKKHEIPRAAGVLAVLGQALAEQDAKQKQPPLISGPALRDAALTVQHSQTHAAARAAVTSIQRAVTGQAKGGQVEYPWNKLTRMHDLMEEINFRNSRLRRAVRRSRDPAHDARHASTMAVLSLVLLVDTHEAHKPAEVVRWRRHALDFQRNMTAVAAALRKRETAKTKPLYLKAAKACNACHAEFRAE